VSRIYSPIGALGLILCLPLATCDQGGSAPFNDLFSGTANDDSAGGATGSSDELVAPESVFGLIDPVRARVRNESSARADVTMRFIRDEEVVHLAFVRVLPDTITTVASPESAEVVELSGLDDRGRALSLATYVFGVDFDATSPAEYRVVDDDVIEPAPEPPVEPPSDRPVLPRLTMVEPADELTVTLGSTFTARWEDSAGSAGVVVTIFLQPVSAGGTRGLIAMGPGVGAALDGINDALEVVVQDLEPGAYRVVGQVRLPVEGGALTATATAPGVVRVVHDPGNAAPGLEIRSPEATIDLRSGDSLLVAWDDSDPDDNATIGFALVSTGRADVTAESFAIGPPIAEDPDGARGDAGMFVVRDVLPGLYDLLGTIDDGELVGTDRVERAVRVLPNVDNDPPQLMLKEPAHDVIVEIGRSLFVRWVDSDSNDDARISLLLDPDLGNLPLDGDEVLLVASLGENEDGEGDQITLGIPPGVANGEYGLVGAITDGSTQTLSRAPGLVRVGRAAPESDGGDDAADDDSGGDDVGIIIDVIPPPLPSPWTVTPLGPTGAVVVQSGEVVTVLFERALDPSQNLGRVYLNNKRYGGSLRTIVEHAELGLTDPKSLLVPIPGEGIPNDAWPRSFDIEVESVVEGVVQIIVGPRPIWVLQDVTILSVELIGNSCIPIGASDSELPDVLIEVSWYGGGLEEVESNAVVQFWLAKDGVVPEGGEGDFTHRLIGQAPGSPNVVRTERFDTDSLIPLAATDDIVATAQPSGSFADVSLEAGEYRLVAVFDPLGVTGAISDPSGDLVAVCDPLRTSDTDEQP